MVGEFVGSNSGIGYVLQRSIGTFDLPTMFAALVILGGRAPEYLRNDPSVLSLVREFAAQNKCIGAIGHGIQVLTAASLTRGRTVTCHENVQVEVERDGGKYVDKPAVRDGKLVTAQTWESHPEFYRELFTCLGEASLA